MMLHLEMTALCDDLIIKDFAVCAICGCATEFRIDVQSESAAAVLMRSRINMNSTNTYI